MEAGGVGIRWVGCGCDVGVVGSDRGRFGYSAVVREAGCAKNGRETRGTRADGGGEW